MRARIGRLMLVLGWLGTPVAAWGQEEKKEDKKTEEKQEASAYDTLWQKVAKLIATRKYAAARAQIERELNEPMLVNARAWLAEDLKDIKLLDKLKEQVFEKCDNYKPGQTIRISRTDHQFVRYDTREECLWVTLPGSTRELRYSLNEINAETWFELATDTATDPYVEGILHAADKNGNRKHAESLLSKASTTHPQALRWLERLEAAKTETKRKQDEETRRKQDQLNETDPFKVGASFKGQRNFIPNTKIVQKVTLVVTKREGKRFEGELTIADTAGDPPKVKTMKVAGIAPQTNQGGIDFTTDKLGYFQQRFTGTYANGAIGFEFSGKNDAGKPATGRGRLVGS